MKQFSNVSLKFHKAEKPARTMSTLPTLKRKVRYNNAETAGREKQDKMQIDEAKEVQKD